MSRGAWSLALAAALFALYAATACRTVGPGDSGELTVALATWGVPHAPGYPLLALIGNLVSHVVHAREPALTLNLMNALFAALACGALASAVTALTGEIGAGLVAGLALGTSRVFWLHALTLEVFSLNALLAALLLHGCCRIVAAKPGERAETKALPMLAGVTTGVLTHHTTLALLAVPAWIACVPNLRRAAARDAASFSRTLRWSVVAAAIGLLPIGYVPIAARLEPPISWGDARSLSGFVGLVTRRDFGTGTLLPPPLAAAQVLRHGESASPLHLRNLVAFGADLPRSFGWAIVPLVLVGLAWTLRRRHTGAVLALGFLAAAGLFFTRVNTPLIPLYQGVTERFFILPHVVLAFLAGCGVAPLIALGRARRVPAALTAAVAALVTGLAMLAVNAPRVDQRDNTFTRDFGANLLTGMPERAVFFSSGDLFHNAVLYQQHGLDRRRDVALVHQELMTLPWYVRQLRRRGVIQLPETMQAMTADSGTWSRAWLDLNADPSRPDARPTVAVKLIDDSWRARYRLVPLGIWSAVVPRDEPVDLAGEEARYAAIVRGWDLRSLERTLAEEGWEASEEVFYPFALGQLLGLRDVISARAPGTRFSQVPALARAAEWRGGRGAEFRAQRADYIRASLEDSTLALTPATAGALALQATALARSALALDVSNVQGLETLAALLAARPELGAPHEELAVRAHIVDARPGDIGEVVGYLRLARRLAAEGGPRAPEIERAAESARARFVRLLRIADQIDPSGGFADAALRWDRPLSQVPDLD